MIKMGNEAELHMMVNCIEKAETAPQQTLLQVISTFHNCYKA